MPSRIEDYGFIGDRYGSALVSREGSIDWLCVPRFDSDACMAALLGRDEHGCWLIHPGVDVRRNARRYRPGTLILETDFECDGGAVRMIDFMPIGLYAQSVIRIIEGLEGSVPVFSWLGARFGYGRNKPWIEKTEDGIRLTVAPDSLILRTPAAVECTEHNVRGQFTVKKGERVPFVLSWQAAHLPPPDPLDPISALSETERWWKEWSGRSRYRGPYKEVVDRSLIVLKAMSYAPTGGIIAAPTTSLPEEVGGVRNWDYRFCWLRDATLTLRALMAGGYVDEATDWRNWLLRAVAGAPEEMQIMYGVLGERRLTEFEALWLPGYEESRPVRIGNAASDQFQLDVYGEVIEAMYEARRMGMSEGAGRGQLRALMEFLSTAWQRPDDGIWEVRGGRQHFVYSKLMAWVAIDRLVRYIEEFLKPEDELHAMLSSIRALRDRIRRDILEHGFNPKLNAFTQAYNSEALDATALLIPEIGFLPGSDPRVQGTIQAIEKNLLRDGFVLRYNTEHTNDGLPGTEGAFLACSFWLVDAYAYSNRRSEAEGLFNRLLSLRNDLGLLSEEYEPRTGRLIGNFPQAFSHLALIQSARVLGTENR
ncbi:MAG: glycoside hydrolase family 15 protein [Nitrospirae bacterium]|nr:glycoside hydrolase family 15 protein [Candidatus Manganitrophaceae bacterium]